MARTGTGLSRLVGTSGRRGHVPAPREPASVPGGLGVQASLRRFAAWTPSAWGVLRARSTTVPQAGLDREIRRQISLSIAIQWEVCRQTSLSERKRLVTWPDRPCRRQPAGSRRPGRPRPGRWVPESQRLRHRMPGEGERMRAKPGSTVLASRHHRSSSRRCAARLRSAARSPSVALPSPTGGGLSDTGGGSPD